MGFCITEARVLPFSHLSLRYLPCCVPCCCCTLQPSTALLVQSRLLFLHPLGVPWGDQAVPAHLGSEQGVLCQLSLPSPPPAIQVCWQPPSPSSTAPTPNSVLISSALPVVLICGTFCHFSAGPLQRQACQFS